MVERNLRAEKGHGSVARRIYDGKVMKIDVESRETDTRSGGVIGEKNWQGELGGKDLQAMAKKESRKKSNSRRGGWRWWRVVVVEGEEEKDGDGEGGRDGWFGGR